MPRLKRGIAGRRRRRKPHRDPRTGPRGKQGCDTATRPRPCVGDAAGEVARRLGTPGPSLCACSAPGARPVLLVYDRVLEPGDLVVLHLVGVLEGGVEVGAALRPALEAAGDDDLHILFRHGFSSRRCPPPSLCRCGHSAQELAPTRAGLEETQLELAYRAPSSAASASRSLPRRWKNAAKDPARDATTEIAIACRRTSITRPPGVIGLWSCEETVSSWVVTQKSESPKFVISVLSACRSRKRMATDAIRSTISVKLTIAMIRSLRCVCVGVSPWNTRIASSQAALVTRMA